jgi:hypothetical protein
MTQPRADESPIKTDMSVLPAKSGMGETALDEVHRSLGQVIGARLLKATVHCTTAKILM